jgi:hypothetical protein
MFVCKKKKVYPNVTIKSLGKRNKKLKQEFDVKKYFIFIITILISTTSLISASTIKEEVQKSLYIATAEKLSDIYRICYPPTHDIVVGAMVPWAAMLMATPILEPSNTARNITGVLMGGAGITVAMLDEKGNVKSLNRYLYMLLGGAISTMIILSI